MGKDERTIRRWVKDHAIPARKAGDVLLIEASDMRRFLPLVNADSQEE